MIILPHLFDLIDVIYNVMSYVWVTPIFNIYYINFLKHLISFSGKKCNKRITLFKIDCKCVKEK